LASAAQPPQVGEKKSTSTSFPAATASRPAAAMSAGRHTIDSIRFFLLVFS
jgi:hypothetical protein